MLGLSTAVLVFAGLYFARSILAPVAFSLFVIAIVWPLQRALETRIPRLLALVATLAVTLLVVTVLGYLIVWAFGTIGRWLIDNALRLQALYMQWTDWLEEHGILVTSFLVENFNAGWLIRAVQEIGGRLHGLLTFVVITFVFTALGLLEVAIAGKNIESLGNKEAARTILQSSTQIAAKFQRYMLVRSAMSVLTGLVVWAFALLAGLELATAWGLIAFVLNYIPFIGPLVATVFPTLFALVQLGSWQLAAIVFVGLKCHPIPDRKLPRASDRGSGAVSLALLGPIRRVLLGLSLGPFGRIHRRPHRDRMPHAVRTARIDAMDRDASVGARAALVSRFRSSQALAAHLCANFGIKGTPVKLMTLVRFWI